MQIGARSSGKARASNSRRIVTHGSLRSHRADLHPVHSIGTASERPLAVADVFDFPAPSIAASRPLHTPVADLIGTLLGHCRKESVRSNNHRLLGENTGHRALRRCLGDRGQERRGEVASGVDSGDAGLAALVHFEDDACGGIDRVEAQ